MASFTPVNQKFVELTKKFLQKVAFRYKTFFMFETIFAPKQNSWKSTAPMASVLQMLS